MKKKPKEKKKHHHKTFAECHYWTAMVSRANTNRL